MYILNNVHIIYIILSIHISMCVSFTYHKKLHGPVTCVLQIYYILPCNLLTIPLYRKTYLILALVIFPHILCMSSFIFIDGMQRLQAIKSAK